MGKNKKDKTPLLLKFVRWFYPILEKIFPRVAHRCFVSLFFTPLVYSIPEEERQIESEAKKIFLEVANKRIQCYAWGSADKFVLLVHGWAGRTTQFRSFIAPLLNACYKVVGFDAPAHGNSTGLQTNIQEFEETLVKIYKHAGEPEAIIAHSFGGSAVLFSAMNGLSVKKLINIASPTIGDEIIKTYLKAINGSAKTGEYFKDYVKRKYGRPFDDLTTLYFVKHLSKAINLLLVHDEEDREVSILQAEVLQRIYPAARLFRTKGLGHTRILRDDTVIQACLTYIQTK